MTTIEDILDLASHNDIEAVRNLLDSNAALVNMQNEQKETPLHRATAKGNGEMAKLLLERGADPNGLSQGWEWRPIVHAAWNNHVDMVKLLIEGGADVTQTDGQPIHYAGQRKHKEICRILVEAGAVDGLIQPPDADTLAVFRAMYSYDAETLSKLLAANPQLADARDVEGRTPMHEAAANGAVEVIQVLLDAGGDPNAKSEGDETPMQRAAGHHHADVCQLLADAGAEIDLFTACDLGWKGHVVEILKRDPEGAKAQRYNYLLIETVCEAGYVEIGRLLVDADAEVDIFTACSLGLKDRVEQFLAADSSLVKAKRPMFDYEPLHCAAECGHPEIVQILLDAGADVNGHNGWRFTPLHLSVIAAREQYVTEDHLKICQTLIENGADVSARDEYNRSPLDLAEGNIRYGQERGESEAQMGLYGWVKELLQTHLNE